MTLQDYLTLTQNNINAFFTNFGPVLANIIAAIVILVIGLIVGAILKRVWVEIVKAINLEKSLSGWETYQSLTKAHDGLDVTTFFGDLLRWLAIVVFLIPAVAALGISGADQVLSTMLGYLPAVIIGSLFLVLGFVFAWFTHRIIMAVSVLVSRNPAHLVADLAALAVIVFALIEALLQFGVSTELIRFFILASFAGFALALGLAGKDSAMDLVKKFMDRVK